MSKYFFVCSFISFMMIFLLLASLQILFSCHLKYFTGYVCLVQSLQSRFNKFFNVNKIYICRVFKEPKGCRCFDRFLRIFYVSASVTFITTTHVNPVTMPNDLVKLAVTKPLQARYTLGIQECHIFHPKCSTGHPRMPSISPK